MTHQLAVGSSALAASAWVPAAAAPSARNRPFTREPRRHASSGLVDFLGPKDGLENPIINHGFRACTEWCQRDNGRSSKKGSLPGRRLSIALFRARLPSRCAIGYSSYGTRVSCRQKHLGPPRSLYLSCRWQSRRPMRRRHHRRRTTLSLGCAKSVVPALNTRARVTALICRHRPFRDHGLLNLRPLRRRPRQYPPSGTNRRSLHHRLRLITHGRPHTQRRGLRRPTRQIMYSLSPHHLRRRIRQSQPF